MHKNHMPKLTVLVVVLALSATPSPAKPPLSGHGQLGLTFPLGQFSAFDKGMASVSAGIGAGLEYNFGGGFSFTADYNYLHFGTDIDADTVSASWRFQAVTAGLRLRSGMIGPYKPVYELAGGMYFPDLSASTERGDEVVSFSAAPGGRLGLGLLSDTSRSTVYELVFRLHYVLMDKDELTPRYGFFTAPESDISGSFMFFTVEGAVHFDIPFNL